MIGIAASAFILWLLARHGKQKLFSCALALILGGALGNVIDRVALRPRGRLPRLPLGGWHFPAFNVADSAIIVGAALLILDELLRVRKAA